MSRINLKAQYPTISNQLDLNNTKPPGFIDQVLNFNDKEWATEEANKRKKYSKTTNTEPTITFDMKMLFRSGIPHELRRKWWFIASKGVDLYAEVGNTYDIVFSRSLDYPYQESFFGGELRILSILPPKVAEQCKSFLRAVWAQNTHIEFSPLIPTVSVILLLYMEPPLAYMTLQSMINRSTEDSWYFTLNRERFLASIEAFRPLIQKYCKSIDGKCNQLKIDIAQIGLALFPVFFLPFTPLQVALTIFDSFINEGRKILVRVAIALIKSLEKELLRAQTAQEFYTVIQKGMTKLSDVKTTHKLLSDAFSINMSRNGHIFKSEESAIRNMSGIMSNPRIRMCATWAVMVNPDIENSLIPTRRSSNPEFSDESNDDEPEHNIALAELHPASVKIQQHIKIQQKIADSAAPTVIGGGLCTPEIFFKLRSALPFYFRSHQLKSVFSLSKHGTFFGSMFQNTISNGPYLIMIQTDHNIFGAFVSDSLHPENRELGRFFGEPSTFVFQCSPFEAYHTKGVNQYFISVTTRQITIGGPKASIFFTDGFQTVISEECETFGSPSFTHDPNGDNIIDFEVYRFIVPTIK